MEKWDEMRGTLWIFSNLQNPESREHQTRAKSLWRYNILKLNV